MLLENDNRIGNDSMPSQMFIAPRPTATPPQINGIPTAFQADIA